MTAPAQQVATFRLPFSLRSLVDLEAVCAREYGKGLVVRQVGEMLVIERPAVERDGSAEAKP
jgi:hypothetical protein